MSITSIPLAVPVGKPTKGQCFHFAPRRADLKPWTERGSLARLQGKIGNCAKWIISASSLIPTLPASFRTWDFRRSAGRGSRLCSGDCDWALAAVWVRETDTKPRRVKGVVAALRGALPMADCPRLLVLRIY